MSRDSDRARPSVGVVERSPPADEEFPGTNPGTNPWRRVKNLAVARVSGRFVIPTRGTSEAFSFDPPTLQSTMHSQFLSTLLAAAALAACAAAPVPDPQVAKQDTSNCPLEYRVGSSIPVRNCNTFSDEQRLQLQREMNELSHSIRHGATAPPGS